MKKNENGFTLVEVLLILIFITLIGFIGWYVWHSKDTHTKPESSATKAGQTNNPTGGVLLSKDYLPFTLKYPVNWEIRSETPTDYGFYDIELQAKGSIVEAHQGEVLKTGALINIIRTADKSTNPENSIGEYATKSKDAKFLVNKKVINLGGVDALEYQLKSSTDGTTNGKQVRFYKDGVLYLFSLYSLPDNQSRYTSVFDSLVKSINFK